MKSAIEIARAHARVLQRLASDGDPQTLAAFAALEGLQDVERAALAETVQRKHALALVARRLGFTGWAVAKRVLAGELVDDWGELLYPGRGAAYWNVWSAHLDEARRIRAEHGGYLLPWRRQFVIVEDHFVEHIGLDPRDAGWATLGRDWLCAGGDEVRARFYAALVARALGVTV
ncbi:MAG: hypothetical protein H6828_03275 [Planctomycetes bacterium]|nr:hypothetical protein [Planctomycetota bacterium]